MLILQCANTTANPINWINFAASVGSALVSIAAIIFGYCNSKKALKSAEANILATLNTNKEITERTLETNIKNTEKLIKSKRTEERKSEIYKSLNDLYGPLYQLRQKSNLLYDKFKEGKANSDGLSESFSTLSYLLENDGPTDLDANDKALLKEIINIGEKCETLIQDKAGLIEDDTLRKEWFPKATKHYLILRLAHNGSLKGQSELYADSKFPIEMDELIQNRITKLQEELRGLS
ncbi:MAG: hypothetical protein WC756_06560 [Taibaiella sp.]|jgi:hypothetical protein